MDQPETRSEAPEPVEADELNAWKRGFTPQAEIWNGRLAMIGLSAGIAVVPVSYTHLRAHETVLDLVCRLLLEKKKR